MAIPKMKGDRRTAHVIFTHVVLLSSMAIYWKLGEALLPSGWEILLLPVLALIWKALEGRVKIPYLARVSVIPAAIGILGLNFSLNNSFRLPELLFLLLSAGYYVLGFIRLRCNELTKSQKTYSME